MQFISQFERGLSKLFTPLIVSFAVILCAGGVVGAQEAVDPLPTPVVTPVPGPTPIPGSEIPGRAGALRISLRRAVARTDVADQVAAIASEFGKEKAHLEILTEETHRRMEIGGPSSVIEEARSAWTRSAGRLDGWLTTLEGISTTIAQERAQLEQELDLWRLTGDSADEVDLPEALRSQIEEVQQAIVVAGDAVRANRDAALTLQSAVADEKSAVDEMLALQDDEIARRRRNIAGLDSPPLWRVLAAPGVHGAPAEQFAAIFTKNLDAVRAYISENRIRLVWQGVFLALLVIGLVVLRRRAAVWVREDRSLERAAAVLGRPVAAAVIVTILLIDIFHPQAPPAWIDLFGLFLLLALLRMLPRIVPPPMRPGANLLALLYFLHKIADLAPDGDPVNRLALFVLSVTAAGSCFWVLIRIREPEIDLSDRWRWVVTAILRLAFAAFVVATLANVVGSVGFSSLVTESTLAGIYAGVLFWVADILMRAIVRVGLLTKTARSLGLVKLHGDTVRQKLFKLIRVLSVAGWFVVTLQGSGALDWVAEGLKRMLGANLSIGDFSFAPGDIVTFFLVVWLSFKISQLIRFVLDTDLLPRLNLDRGVSGAVDRLSHYAIVVVGVMVGASAAGLDFSRINLIVGALGVGIGFGLQNVVNNFVSGLILLFERPVRIGDRVQLGTLDGEVKDIGMRASVVRTWQGAEIIVPNANLISSEVTNWTLSDDRRRVDLPVGVAYGTDPEIVIELLLNQAIEHPEVLSNPKPRALFLGFGASSLDFQLRAWTRSNHFRVSSELLVAVNAALGEAGIEVPFPQRDIHIRSVDEETAHSISESVPGSRENPLD